ncbi:MAG: hypothetical protein B6241_13415 [Spirochaetaceae bacterium 4572_59]|nr:MAG: hypothetical protein B6241_13415 [Spirochaetaceae bacterium 4572_59]
MSLLRMLEDDSISVTYALNSSSAKLELKAGSIDLILLDVRLGDESGLDVLKKLRQDFSTVPVIMLTGFGTIETAVESMKFGASDYLLKPVQYKVIGKKIDDVISQSVKVSENSDSLIVSRDLGIEELKSTILKLSSSNLPILLYGENGTGKELFADFVYSSSNRKGKPFIKVNCASFPDSLLDNELFGHEKGAYTGAHTTYQGVFEKADSGTLFLDEIGDMSLEVQAKVLRVLQNKELYRLGGKELIKVDVRLISATNKKLDDLIREGKFREDLYYRLNAAIMIIPPLKNRISDIPLLIESFLKENARENNSEPYILKADVLEHFLQYPWPGNIRELKNALKYASAISVDAIIDMDCLPVQLKRVILNEDSAVTPLECSEKETILRELMRTNFNKKKVAESLNISRTTLYSKLKKYELNGFSD